MEGIYRPEEIPIDALIERLSLVPHRKGRSKRKQPDYLDIVTAFDIETTKLTFPDRIGEDSIHSFMYHWQFQLGPEYTITGRTWEEFTDFMTTVLRPISAGVEARRHREMKTAGRPLWICYVHNLSFEFFYLQGVYHFENDDCFFTDPWKPLYARLNNLIEFRCSYRNSNMSLDAFCKFIGTSISKLDGHLYDYNKLRFPWTPLTDYELNYCVNDVRCLEEAIRTQILRDRDTLRTIPLTKTGYVRRDCKAALAPMRYSIEMLLPDIETYDLLRRCFRGGDTHANRYRVGTVQRNGHALDIESSYPAVQLTQLFPMGPFQKIQDTDNTLPRIINLIKVGNAVIADYHFKDLKLKDPQDAFPYLSVSKCHLLAPETDNGRVLSADLCTTALTEIDLEIVLEQYDYSTVSVYNARTARKGMLPPKYREVIKKYYQGKTEYKGKEGHEYLYHKLKAMLNSIYGMSAQQAIHMIIYYMSKNKDFKEPYIPDDIEYIMEQLEQAAFPYQWGVYTTAYARKALRDGMECIGKDEHGISNLIYCDTDSLKYIGRADLTALNKKLQTAAAKNGATAKDISGNVHYIGTWSTEPDFKEFLTLGAKRYCYRDMAGQLHITVSGVSHKPHIIYNDDGTIESKTDWAVDELIAAAPDRDPMESFKAGMTWREAGGTDTVYHKDDDFEYTDPESGRSVHISPNVTIVDSSYTLKMEKDYTTLIKDCALWLKYLAQEGRIEK